MLAPVLTGCTNTTTRLHFDAAIKHRHLSAGDTRHEMHFVHITNVTDTEKLARDF